MKKHKLKESLEIINHENVGMKLGVDTTIGDTAKYKSIKIKAERHW